MNNIVKYYNDWNEQCRKEYDCLFPEAEYTIWDGVIFPERYAKSPLKIMFMNRESSESNFEPDFKGYDLAEALREQIIDAIPIFKGQTRLRQRLKE